MFIASIFIGTFLVVSPKKLTHWYPIDDRNIGFAIIILGALYFRFHVVNPATGLQSVVDSIATPFIFIGIAGMIARKFGFDW